MPTDTSIYGNIQQPQIQAPNPLQSMQQAMQLGQMGMQQMQQARQLKTQSDIQDAMYRNTDPQTGQLDQSGVISQLGKTNPLASQQMGESFAAHNKAQAEAKGAQVDAAQKNLSFVGPALEYFHNTVPQDQKADVWPQMVQQLKGQGVDTANLEHPYDPQLEKNYLSVWANNKSHWENLVAQASIPKAQAEIKNAEFGGRSPVTTLTDQYANEPAVKIARQSQVAMNQMHDNYKNPTPQGDASLILNAFKIKFPNAPDVNSLEELSKSQAAPDQFKQWASKAIAGGLDQPTRDNLMRDGISTFRANIDAIPDTQKKYKDYAAKNGITAPNLDEPAISKTWNKVSDLQNNIGPYVPPAQRGGISGAIAGALSKITGTGGSRPAQAQEKTQYRQSGATVSADELAQYATKHGKTLKEAQSYLKGQGYVIGR